MNNDFSKNLIELRKQKGLTQQQLADSLNISTAAVCKWEKGKNLPDLPMLMLISEFFHTSIDKLVFNRKQLSDEEIDKICKELDETIIKKGAGQGLEYIDSIYKEYAYDKNLVIALVTALQKNEILINDELSKKSFLEKQEMLLLKASLSEDQETGNTAKYLLGCFYIRKKDYIKAEKYISEISKSDFSNTQELLLTVYMCKGEFKKAKDISKRVVLSSISSVNNVLLCLQKMYIDNDEKNNSKQILELHNNLINSLDVNSLFGNSLYQSQMLYAEKYHDKDLMISAIKNFIDFWIIKKRSKSKFEIFQMPVNQDSEKDDIYNHKFNEIILKDFKENPKFDFVRDDKRFTDLIDQISF